MMKKWWLFLNVLVFIPRLMGTESKCSGSTGGALHHPSDPGVVVSRRVEHYEGGDTLLVKVRRNDDTTAEYGVSARGYARCRPHVVWPRCDNNG